MANYFVLDNTFTPYSFDEMVKPFQIYGEAYKEQEKNLSTLTDQLGAIESVLSDEDVVASARYNAYRQALEQQVAALTSKGLTPETRTSAGALRTNYSKSIAPIIVAAQKRDKLREELRKARLQDPTLIVQNSLDTATIDDFLANPDLNYGMTFSGNVLTAMSSRAAKALAKSVKDKGEDGKIAKAQLERILPYQYRVLEQHGFNEDEVLAAINNNEGALAQIAQDVLASSGIKSWNSLEALNAAKDYINAGLWDAIGETKYHYLNDSYSAQLDLMRQKAAQESASKRSAGLGIDRAQFIIPTHRKKVEDFLDKNGKLTSKVSFGGITGKKVEIDNTKLFDKNGKFTRPKPEKIYTYGMGYTQPTAADLYDDISNTLKEMGYSQKEISNLTKPKLETILRAIRDNNELDATSRYSYRLPVSADAAKDILGRSKYGEHFNEFVGFKNGASSFKPSKDSKFDDKIGADLLYDDLTQTAFLKQGDRMIQVPLSIFSDIDRTTLKNPTLNQQTNKLNIIRKYLEKTPLSDEEENYLEEIGFKNLTHSQKKQYLFSLKSNIEANDYAKFEALMSSVQQYGMKNITPNN